MNTKKYKTLIKVILIIILAILIYNFITLITGNNAYGYYDPYLNIHIRKGPSAFDIFLKLFMYSFLGFVFIGIPIIVVISSKKQKVIDDAKQEIKVTELNDAKIKNRIMEYIPTFNKVNFLEECYRTYCDVQTAWMNFKLEDVKDELTDELYNMYESQLATLEVKGEQNIMKDFTLTKAFLKDVVNQNSTITITTIFEMSFYDYIIQKQTGTVLRGSSTRKMHVRYEMKFRQTLDESKKVNYCPNCGAKIEMNSSGICSYCRTKLVTENTKWVLTDKKVISQF